MSVIPPQHIADSHKLNADGVVELFELTPSLGSGTVRFKSDNDVTWRGNLYTGVPLSFSGESFSVSGGSPQPRLIVGQQDIDLSLMKQLIFDGTLDGGTVVRMKILLDDLLNNRLVRQVFYYRVRRVETYTSRQITLQLASTSDSLGSVMPFLQYTPPAFPAVLL